VTPLDPARLRLFIAVVPPPAILGALATMQRNLERDLQQALRSTAAAPVRPGAIHLTLRFLGDTPRDRLPAIIAALDETAATTTPHSVRLDALGSFGGRRPRLVYAALAGDTEQLAALAHRLDAALAARGILPPERGFRPHLTLARVPNAAGRADRDAIGDVLASATPPPPLPIPIDRLLLVRSDLRPHGARYTSLAQANLRA
jgi:2'-5' RNA ligase